MTALVNIAVSAASLTGAPLIVASVDGDFRPLIACVAEGKRRKAKEQGGKPPIMRSTINVRDDNIGKSPLCRAGVARWRPLQYPDGTERHTMPMVTVNADEHPIMKPMHRPGAEKRSVVILRPDDWEEWLTTSNIEAARAMLQLYPADDMVFEPN
ncbi:DUF159 family protein [Burkholderia multivorans]|uniref:SOS response-associated peptidase family protein n=1 Tax=Burkholderia multivorans TaxID=87883 RepID=UPI0020B3E504|nr:SOS response-associated peptidase family protein [Burkholderia multivorans]MCA8413421.1 DUF159 family protein [Burkholderia multivorans]MDN7949506.1 DUF159 family protein [Burkholderia multivorans]MDN7961910.1 DUF159 family protein [Burkholderia multivorans]